MVGAAGEIEQFRGELSLWVGLLVPQRERTLQGIDAEAVWALDATADIGGLQGQSHRP
ncbi:hypothetical protein [Streptacidiphilus sp. MAP5-3]|uniref:hypothetical protein n=1 Tax=unclassified Streptacidiphilus TaxID=2643834 RepID=UPI0035172C2D